MPSEVRVFLCDAIRSDPRVVELFLPCMGFNNSRLVNQSLLSLSSLKECRQRGCLLWHVWSFCYAGHRGLRQTVWTKSLLTGCTSSGAPCDRQRGTATQLTSATGGECWTYPHLFLEGNKRTRDESSIDRKHTLRAAREGGLNLMGACVPADTALWTSAAVRSSSMELLTVSTMSSRIPITGCV